MLKAYPGYQFDGVHRLRLLQDGELRSSAAGRESGCLGILIPDDKSDQLVISQREMRAQAGGTQTIRILLDLLADVQVRACE